MILYKDHDWPDFYFAGDLLIQDLSAREQSLTCTQNIAPYFDISIC